MSRLRAIAQTLLPPLLVAALALVGWELAVAWLAPPPYLLPAPRRVLDSLAGRAGADMLGATARTALAAAGGLAISAVGGTLLALLFAIARPLRRALYPYTIFFQTVPVVAIAPLVILWFGNGMLSVVIVAATLSIFPVISGMTQGLLSVDAELLELFRAQGASRWQTLLKLRLPSSLPLLLAGLRVGGGLAVIGAIVGEFFAGFGGQGEKGLGYWISVGSHDLATHHVFAAVIASTALGLLLFGLVSAVSQLVLARYAPDRDHA